MASPQAQRDADDWLLLQRLYAVAADAQTDPDGSPVDFDFEGKLELLPFDGRKLEDSLQRLDKARHYSIARCCLTTAGCDYVEERQYESKPLVWLRRIIWQGVTSLSKAAWALLSAGGLIGAIITYFVMRALGFQLPPP